MCTIENHQQTTMGWFELGYVPTSLHCTGHSRQELNMRNSISIFDTDIAWMWMCVICILLKHALPRTMHVRVSNRPRTTSQLVSSLGWFELGHAQRACTARGTVARCRLHMASSISISVLIRKNMHRTLLKYAPPRTVLASHRENHQPASLGWFDLRYAPASWHRTGQ
jgi:hypothetical protein